MTSIRLPGLLLTVSLAALSMQAIAQGQVDLEDMDQRMAYALGVNVGQGLSQQGLLEGLDVNVFMAGVLDSVANNPQLDNQQVGLALQAFQQRMQERAQAEISGNLEASEAFLAENGQRDGVVVLDSGLQYEIMESGPAGGDSPSASDSVLAHYHGTLADGSVFDSSVQRGEPAQFGLSQVIAGWTEALQLMKVGDKWRLYIPPGLAYGEASPSPAIPPNSALVFEVELLEIR